MIQIDTQIILMPSKQSYSMSSILTTEPSGDGTVVFLVNKTKRNFINTGGYNSDDVIDCIHAFLHKYGIWNESDQIIKTYKSKNFTPANKDNYHDISFVLTFYNMSVVAKEQRENDTTYDSYLSQVKKMTDQIMELEEKNKWLEKQITDDQQIPDDQHIPDDIDTKNQLQHIMRITKSMKKLEKNIQNVELLREKIQKFDKISKSNSCARNIVDTSYQLASNSKCNHDCSCIGGIMLILLFVVLYGSSL